MSNWHYSVNNQQLGPISEAELRQLIDTGQIAPSSLVWNESMTDWTPAHMLPQFSRGSGAISPPMSGEAGAMPFAGYAGFWKRFLAAFIDGIITFIAMFMIQIVLGIAMFATGGISDQSALGGQIVYIVVGQVFSWLYMAGFHSSSLQATPGKMALGMIVTDLNGNRISFLRATGRYFAKILSALTLMIGYIMAAFTPKKQALHDMIAGTLVVNKP